MTTGAQRWFATSTTALALISGCAQPGPLTSRNSMMGQMRASVAQTQQENERLKREVADLQVENRQTADRLDEQEQENGQLHARLDDARTALRSEGSSLADVSPSSTPSRRTRTTPAGRATRKAHQAPFARINNRIEDTPADELEATEPKSREDLPNDDLNPQSRRDRSSQWLPVGPRDSTLR